MSNSPLVDYVKISPYRNSPRNHKIDTVTIHCMVAQWSPERCGEEFSSPNRRASSNYGIGPDGRIGMYVEEKDRSWCSNSPSNDNRAITIEVASDTKHPYAVTDAAFETLIKLLADICKRNDIKELKWRGDKSLIGQIDKQNMTVHRWFANKACPGDYLYNRHGEIAKRVNALLTPSASAAAKDTRKAFIRDIQAATGAAVDGIAGPETISKTPTLSARVNRKHKCVKIVQRRLAELGYNEVGIADGIAGPKFTAAVKAYQRDHKCVVDGVITARNKTWKTLLGMI